jgi:hypothetical protein
MLASVVSACSGAFEAVAFQRGPPRGLLATLPPLRSWDEFYGGARFARPSADGRTVPIPTPEPPPTTAPRPRRRV